jgi:hypothetical protein
VELISRIIGNKTGNKNIVPSVVELTRKLVMLQFRKLPTSRMKVE